MGTQQSGVLNLKVANLLKDADILKEARYSALEILKDDPTLVKEKNKNILVVYKRFAKKSNLWSNIS